MNKIGKDRIKKEFILKYQELFNKSIQDGTDEEKYKALGSLIMSYIQEYSMRTNQKYNKTKEKQVYYFSMEFLLGRLLGDVLINMGIYNNCKEALNELNINLRELEELE